MTKRIVKNSIRCKHCKDTLVSRHRHDFVSCKCGRVAVDGGKDYLRRAGNVEDYEDLSIVEDE